VFDEHVFPFAQLHPDAGVRLRFEISLLPDSLLGGVNANDQFLINSSTPDNTSANTRGPYPFNPEHNVTNLDANTHDFMQFLAPAVSGTQPGADTPAAPSGGSASDQEQISQGAGTDLPSTRGRPSTSLVPPDYPHTPLPNYDAPSGATGPRASTTCPTGCCGTATWLLSSDRWGTGDHGRPC
jgi:hypothetical protein